MKLAQKSTDVEFVVLIEKNFSESKVTFDFLIQV